MKRKLIVSALVTLACGSFSAVVAQTVEGLSIQEIERRAADHAEDAQALFDFVTANGEAHQEQAQTVVDASHDAIRDLDVSDIQGADGPIDLDEMLAGAQSAMSEPKGAPLFIAFASLSMPEQALSRMIADTTRAGGVVVFRGFSAGSPAAFIAGIQKVVEQQGASNVAIDPRLFRAFNVDRVPTYIAVSRDFEPCDQLDCVSQTPPYDRIAGNITAEYALSVFSDADGPGAAVSKLALSNLRNRR